MGWRAADALASLVLSQLVNRFPAIFHVVCHMTENFQKKYKLLSFPLLVIFGANIYTWKAYIWKEVISPPLAHPFASRYL